jgi:hypothetical protein
MLYCQSAPDAHRAPAVYALTFSRKCGHEYPACTLVCLQHGAEQRANPIAAQATACERCGATSPLNLVRVEDVFEERVVVSILRTSLEHSAHAPVTFAYDRAYRAAADRGLVPVTTYRVPVQWSSRTNERPISADVLEAHVTMAVTLHEQPSYRAG